MTPPMDGSDATDEGAPRVFVRPAKPVKAYRNSAFIDSSEARVLRILAEYLEPDKRFRESAVDDTIVFFGSARLMARDAAETALAAARAVGAGVAQAETALAMSRYYEDARQLADRLTAWSKSLAPDSRRFVVCSGGGPGIMEAANRGASEARGLNIGLNIALPFEQAENPYITRNLAFEFHYFFMRKFWFTYLAKAMVFFPGGFGTLDEFFEVVTLVQTRKMTKHMPIVLFGTSFWRDVLDFEPLVRQGTISKEDLDLFLQTDSVDEAFDYVTEQLRVYALDRPGGGM